jgi:hypothetical protein
LKNGAGGVHDQLCQKTPVETNRRIARVDYPGNVGENEFGTSLDPDSPGYGFSAFNRGPVAQLGARPGLAGEVVRFESLF